MNKHHKLLATALSFAVSIGIASAAFAQEAFQGTITLGPDMVGQFQAEDLGIGDNVSLTLVNPTNQALTFRTTNMLGMESSWVVPANSQRTISFDYNTPFSDDVEYVVIDPNNTQISQGVLFNMDEDVALGEDVFRRTITLRPGMGEIAFDDLGVGDTLVLTLVNPTNQTLSFETTERLGQEQRVVVPPNSQRTIAYEYTQWFSDDVQYMVMEQPTGTVISQGVLIPAQQQTVQQQPVYTPPVRQTIRGYW